MVQISYNNKKSELIKKKEKIIIIIKKDVGGNKHNFSISRGMENPTRTPLRCPGQRGRGRGLGYKEAEGFFGVEMPLGRPGFARDGGLAKADTSPEAKGFTGAGGRGWTEAVVVPLGIFQPLRPGGDCSGDGASLSGRSNLGEFRFGKDCVVSGCAPPPAGPSKPNGDRVAQRRGSINRNRGKI